LLPQFSLKIFGRQIASFSEEVKQRIFHPRGGFGRANRITDIQAFGFYQ
jgi:hypothetical protein